MPSLLDAPPQLPTTRGWDALCPVEETTNKPRHLLDIPATAAAKKPVAYGGGRMKNLETCNEALGCETGGLDGFHGGCVEAGNAERKRRVREEHMVTQKSACQFSARLRGPLPPPLTTLALGAGRVRMVHERRGGRLEVYAVRSPGVLEAERGDGRLLLRLLPQEPEDEKEEEAKEAHDEEYGFAKLVRASRCLDQEVGAAVAAASLCMKWEPEQAQPAAFWVASS
jgi:hypothetical protein